MSNIGVTYNNPGNLTVGNGVSYPGQTGVYNSPNGLSYAEFGSPQAGSNALVGWLQNNLGTDPGTSLSTLGQTLSYYLNGSYDPTVKNTSANPDAVSYAQSVAQSMGIGLNQNFTAAQLSDPGFMQQIGAAISGAEGTSSVYNFGSGGTMSFANAADYLDGANNAYANSSTGQAQAQTGGLQSTSSSCGKLDIGCQITTWLNKFVAGFESGIQTTLVRGGFVAVGFVLLAAGIVFIVVNNNKSQIVSAAKDAIAA